MTMDPYAAMRRQRQRLGLVFGLFAGAGFAALTWGSDGWLLAQAHASLSWLKLGLGSVFCLLVGGLVGWWSGRLDNGLFSFFAWLLTGGVFVYFTSRLPFDVVTWVATRLDPALGDLSVYPFPSSVQFGVAPIYIFVLLLSGLAGALCNVLVEASRAASAPLARWLPLLAWLPFFALSGYACDGINAPLRQAIVGTHATFQLARQNGLQPIDEDPQNPSGLRAVLPLGDLLRRPYRLTLADYDADYMDTINVFVDFEGVKAYCIVYLGRPTYCRLSQEDFQARIGCLLHPDGRQDCNTDLTENAAKWLMAWTQAGLPEPQVAVQTQTGAYSWLRLTAADGRQFECLFRGLHLNSRLENCQPDP